MSIAATTSRLDTIKEQVLWPGLSQHQKRLWFVAGAVVFFFFLLLLQLTRLMVLDGVNADDIRPGSGATTFSRGDILDRNGEVLATNLFIHSLFANPKQILDVEEAVRGLLSIFPTMNPDELRKKLQGDKTFTWIQRHITPKQHQEVYQLGLPGIYTQREEKRIYPYGEILSHVVGYTDIDMSGLGGIERSFESVLSGKASPVTLSVDVRVQSILHEELKAGMEKFSAIGASGLVMDVDTGEVIAMVSLPDFDPHHPTKEGLFNRNTLGVYEMGSIFKVMTLAMGFESGKIKMSDGFDARGSLKVGRFTINDYYGKNRWLTIPEIFLYSSNLGTARIALTVGRDFQYQFFKRMGLLDPVPIELQEVGRPHAPSVWRDINAITASYGYGISVSPLHMAAGVSAIVNGGMLYPPTLLKKSDEPKGRQVVSADTSDKMRRLMHMAIKQGTGRKTDVPGYVVGGKTGSANKSLGTERGKGYKNLHLASVVAAFPMNAPKYLLLLTLDEPKGTKETHGFATGGWTVAPTVRNVIRRIGPLLGVMPQDEASETVQTAMYLKVGSNDVRALG